MLSLAGLLCFLAPSLIDGVTLRATMTDSAQGLLSEALDRNLSTFVTVSAVKALIALIEGSSVGIGFDLEVGDIVQPAYDYVDFIWKVFLYAFMILGFYQLLLDSGLLDIGRFLLGAGLICFGVSLLPWERGVMLRPWARPLLLFGVLIAYVVPASLLSADYVSTKYLLRLKASNEEEIDTLKVKLEAATDDLFALRDEVSLFRPGESLDAIKTQTAATASQVSEIVWEGMQEFMYFVLIVLAELLVLPFLSAFVLYKLLAAATRGLKPPERAQLAVVE